MVSDWTNFNVEQVVFDKFEDLCKMWEAWQQNKTANPDKLAFRINATFDEFSNLEKEQFTKYVIDNRRLSDEVIEKILNCSGTIRIPAVTLGRG